MGMRVIWGFFLTFRIIFTLLNFVLLGEQLATGREGK